MQNVSAWIEYAKLAVSAVNPILTGVIAFVLLRLGTKIESTRQLNQALLTKRLSFYESVAPLLNDVYCFSQARGHWIDLTPQEIIKRKRQLDSEFYINQYLFEQGFLSAYLRFVNSFFEMFTGVGKPAQLLLDVNFLRRQIGSAFRAEWDVYISEKPCDHQTQAKAYEALMIFLGREVKGDRSRPARADE